MFPRLLRLRPAYRPGVGPIVQPYIQPGRRVLLVYRERHPPLRIALVVAVVCLAALSPGMSPAELAPLPLLVVLYLGWILATHWIGRQPWMETPTRRQWLSSVRKGGTLLGVTLLLWSSADLSPELWLLYLLPMLSVGVDLRRGWALPLIGLTAGLALLSPFAQAGYRAALDEWGSPLWWLGVRDGGIRALVVGFTGFSTYLLHHIFAYQYHRMQEVNRQLSALQVGADWPSNAKRIADLLSTLFSGEAKPTGYILVHDKETDKMYMIGSSSPEGQQMVQDRFSFPVERGIVGWTAKHAQPCFLNDTHDDPEHRFLVSEASPDTRSALSVPVMLEGEDPAVLEVESTLPNDFAHEDLQVMELVSTQVIALRRQMRELEMHRRLAELGKRIACRIHGPDALAQLLEEVGEAALALLDADVVRFYYQPPASYGAGPLRIQSVGLLRSPSIVSRPNDPRSIVHHLMQHAEPRYFESAQSDPHLTTRQPWHVEQGIDPFVVREQIASCAVIPLVTGNQCIGLMWVNYRRPQSFDEAIKNRIELVAPFAMLAIHSAQQSILAENRRRDEFRSMIHDSLCLNTRHAEQNVAMLAAATPGSEAWQRWLFLARVQTARANRIANVLHGRQEYLTLQAVIDDLHTSAAQCRSLYQIEAAVRAEIEPAHARTRIGLKGGSELIMACDEVVQNALRHAKPSRIEIDVHVMDGELHVVIADDGCGFDYDRIGRAPGHGLESVRSRVEQSLNGRLTVESQPQAGTRISMSLPLPR